MKIPGIVVLLLLVCTGLFAQSKVYTIGDAGPAGGIVFYDKGAFSDGWRYIEAAPPETEFTAEWGAHYETIDSPATGVGKGKRNTQVIVESLRELEETGRAAQLCADMDFNGYRDWFLPSLHELDLMYKNLKTKGLGGFTDDVYWSSSENGSYFAWFQRFADGSRNDDLKNLTFRVRAARAF